MQLEWLGKYRDIIGAMYRAANAYSSLCKGETLGGEIRFSPYEVQIMEYIIEYENEYHNMKWHAKKMGLYPSTYSKYVKKLVEKGFIEKYKTKTNSKNIVLKVSELGLREYAKYAEYANKTYFHELFEKFNLLTDDELKQFEEILNTWGGWFSDMVDMSETELIRAMTT